MVKQENNAFMVGFVFVLCGVLRGTTPLILKIGGDDNHANVVFLVAARSAPTVVLFAITILFLYYTDLEYRGNVLIYLTRPKSYLYLAIMGFNTVVPFICFAWALKHISSGDGGVLMALSPMVALLLGQFPCLRKGNRVPLTWPKIIGMLISLGGVVCIFIRQILHPSGGQSGSSQALGVLVYFIGVCATAFMALIWKRLKKEIHYTLGSLGQSVSGGIMSVILWYIWPPFGELNVITQPNGHHFVNQTINGTIHSVEVRDEASMNLTIWLVVAYLGIGSGFLVVLSLYYLYDKIGAVRTQQVLYIVPIVSVLEDALFEHAWKGSNGAPGAIFLQLIGVVLVLTGLRVSSFKSLGDLFSTCASDGGDDDTGPETVDIYGAGGSKVFLHHARRPLMEAQLSVVRPESQPTSVASGSRATMRTSSGAMDVI